MKQQQAKAVETWTEIIQTPRRGSQGESSSSKQTWADEVVSQGKKKSIKDEFDIANLSNAGYKLEYVARSKQGKITGSRN